MTGYVEQFFMSLSAVNMCSFSLSKELSPAAARSAKEGGGALSVPNQGAS